MTDLAGHLGIHPKSFYNVRLGHTTVSLDALSRVMVLFGESRTVRELVLHYLRDEYPTLGRAGRARSPSGGAALPAAIPGTTRWRVAAWVAQLPRTDGISKGLYLQSRDAGVLAATARFIHRDLERLRCSVVVVNAHARLTAAHARAAEEAAVLIVERIEHASESVSAVLLRRHAASRPSVATACVDRATLPDRHLRRIAETAMQRLTLDPPDCAAVPARVPLPPPTSPA